MRGNGKESPSRSPEAEAEEPRASEGREDLLQSQQSWVGGPDPCVGCRKSQGHGALSRRAGSGIRDRLSQVPGGRVQVSGLGREHSCAVPASLCLGP